MIAYGSTYRGAVILLSLLACVDSWKTCKETFCDKVRTKPTVDKCNNLDLSTLEVDKTYVEAELKTDSSSASNLRLRLEVTADSIFRLLIDENDSKRFRALKALDEKLLKPQEIKVDKNATVAEVIHGKNKAVIRGGDKFKIEFYNEGRLVSVANSANRLNFEMIEPQVAVGMDVSFPGVQRAYGIPEHADSLALRNTLAGGNDPYRHYNVDYGSYKVLSTESLYGTIPVLYAHGVTKSSGVFWLNSAQTWIDVTTAPDHVDAHFMSESGAIEMFVLTGPTLPEAVRQFAKLTGTAPLPQYFTLGYHQSRYSYMSQEEVKEVVSKFDEHELPLDVVWLDIDYTDEKKYFTWDPKRFSDPEGLLQELNHTNRKLVAIIDPHYKVDDKYDVHLEAKSKHYYVRNKDGNTDFVGKCWPGNSSYMDYFNEKAFDYYASLYKTKKEFNHKNIHLWNDMNEPAIFDDYEKNENTMAGDLLHDGQRKHRDVHNMYGFHMAMATHKGLLDRNLDVRPFILTRSHFAGIQRYAAIWTGDNYATWDYLRISIPMCLTEALAGVSFCGADVGGFGGIPTDELYQRWYQAGAWLPFYRGHSGKDVPRREPYLYPNEIKNRVKNALHQRYVHLPYWYTLFFEHERTADPVIRPITYHYPTETDALSIDNQFLVGDKVLAAPVLEQGVLQITVYFPGGPDEIWYNIDDNYKAFRGSGYQHIDVNLNSTPVFYRGGSIIPRKDTPRQTSVATHKDNFTLYIALDNQNTATGTLYVDDYETYEYKTNRKYVYITLFYSANNTLNSTLISNKNVCITNARIERVVILNPPTNIVGANFLDNYNHSHSNITTNYSHNGTVLYLNDLSLRVEVPFNIQLVTKSSCVAVTISG